MEERAAGYLTSEVKWEKTIYRTPNNIIYSCFETLLNEKTILIDILNRMCGLHRPVKCRYVGGVIEVRHLKML